MARVSTSPTPEPARSLNRRNALLDCRMAMMVGIGGEAAERGAAVSFLGGADDSGDDGAVAVAVLGTVAARHVVTAGNEVGQQPVPGYPGVDDRHRLTRSPGQLPDACRSIPLSCRRVGCRVDVGRGRSSCGRVRSARSPPAVPATSVAGSSASFTVGGATARAGGDVRPATQVTATTAMRRNGRGRATSCRLRPAHHRVDAADPAGKGNDGEQRGVLECCEGAATRR